MTTNSTRISFIRILPRQFAKTACLAGPLLLAAAGGACSDQLAVTNPNSPSTSAAMSDPAALQLMVTGILANLRTSRTGQISLLGRFGRESFSYQLSEPRPTTHILIGLCVGCNKLDPAGNGASDWSFGILRNLAIFKKAVSNNPLFSDAQKKAALGFALTWQAEQEFEQIAAHDTVGIVLDINDDPTVLAPFVSRDSAFKAIIATLNLAVQNLAAGGTAFPFTLPSGGYAGFNTPATFAKFTQGMLAKVQVYYASIGGGATAWQAASAALSASFLNLTPTSQAGLDVGVYHLFSTAAGDASNGLSAANNKDYFAHPSFTTEAEKKPDGTLDARYLRKIQTVPIRTPPNNIGIPSSIGFIMWPDGNASVAALRNEELIVLHAEVMLGTGNIAAVIQDINTLRTVSGGLAPSALTTASPAHDSSGGDGIHGPDVAGGSRDVLTALLYEKRYSVMNEAVRWSDMRRYNRLYLLPIDIKTGPTTHFVAKVEPIPQGECDLRKGLSGNFLGPNGQNNCP